MSYYFFAAPIMEENPTGMATGKKSMAQKMKKSHLGCKLEVTGKRCVEIE